MKNEIKHTAHSTYRCEYHIVFAPKYRRKEIYGQLKKDIGEIIRKLCNEKKVEIIEAEACPDHIHMLVSVPPYISIAQFVGFLKGKSTLMKYSTVCRISQGEKHIDDIRQACELKIQVREQKFLVPRVLCRYNNPLKWTTKIIKELKRFSCKAMSGSVFCGVVFFNKIY